MERNEENASDMNILWILNLKDYNFSARCLVFDIWSWILIYVDPAMAANDGHGLKFDHRTVCGNPLWVQQLQLSQNVMVADSRALSCAFDIF